MSSIITEVTNYLNKLLHFFEPVQLLANSHFASLFSENVWSEHVPKSIQEELSKTNSLNDFTEFYMEILKSRGPTEFARNHPTLTCFLQEAFDLSISSGKNHLSSLVSLEDLFSDKGISAGTDFSSTEFMSEKKLHEVKASAKVTAFLSDLTKSSHVIDVGGGKGYLSCVLVLHHSHKVLGLDASQLKTCGAEKMSEKLAKQWTELGLDEGNLKSRNGGKNWRLEFLKNRYKLAMTYVTPRTNVKKIVEDNFGDKVGGLTLTGLHTCGDLSPTCLRMFLNNDNITSMLNVGCCYHLIREMFSGEKADSLTRDEEMGFPLSTFLRQKKFSLGRNARMLASYSLDRINSRSNVDEVRLAD